ncbi:MBL fold metallo-hydrolase [Saccharopolyspora sp. SCSIO 74807]|uniref:MBL fold metallo-hydrolase n=1 Tax=Saccharopolyspora sp. SCSIO 74807 TaxID=3118084 RepID=UPI0030D405BD
MEQWREVADRVFVRRHSELDLSTGLVFGSARALVVDTRGDREQGAELAAAVREVTSQPWEVVLTHGHFDHYFGTAAFLPAPVRAHANCPRYLDEHAERQRAEWVEHYRAEGRHELATALSRTNVAQPDRLVHDRAEIDLGDRIVQLHHLGAGHTDHDLVAQVPDAGVVFAGDLVEQGAPPDFEDAFPESWPAALAALLQLRPEIVVPGHGNPVDAEFVRGQRAELAALAGLCASFRTAAISETEALRASPYPAETTGRALRRALAA